LTTSIAYSIRSLTHRYDGSTVLDIPQLDLFAGRIYSIAGPNGAGKTTLLHIMALLMQPTSGKIIVNNIEITNGFNRDTLRRQVTLIHQNPVLFSTTVNKNLAFGLKVRGLSHIEISKRISEISTELSLSGFGSRHVKKLSGGEAQRVVLARSLVLQTPILLLDEPSSFLDSKFRPMLMDLLREANRIHNTTIIFATHDYELSTSLAHEILYLDSGKLIDKITADHK